MMNCLDRSTSVLFSAAIKTANARNKAAASDLLRNKNEAYCNLETDYRENVQTFNSELIFQVHF